VPISERELRRLAAHRDASVIIDDQPCRRCSYNLKGLKRGGVCPECGEPITLVERRVSNDATLVTAPRHYLVRLSVAARLMFWSAVLGPPSTVVCGTLFSQAIIASISVVFWGSVWALGVALGVGRRLPGENSEVPEGEDRTLIVLARSLQLAWIGAGLFLLLAEALPALATKCGATALALVFVGYVGAWPLMLRWATIADAAADMDLARGLRQSIVVMLAALPLAGVATTIVGVLATLFTAGAMPKQVIVAFGILLPFVVPCWYLWRIMGLATWAVRISREREARDARFVERSKKAPDAGGPRLCPHCGENVSAVVRTMRCPRCGEMTV
jgi:hypothetical protein